MSWIWIILIAFGWTSLLLLLLGLWAHLDARRRSQLPNSDDLPEPDHKQASAPHEVKVES